MSKYFNITINYSSLSQLNSTTTLISNKDLFAIVISYIALIIIVLALVGNSTSFIIFRFNKNMKVIPSMIILSFVCITDTFSLFTWNLNHYLDPNFNFSIEKLSKYNCKFFTFIQYTSLESSGLLLSLVCVDRYFTIVCTPASFFRKLPFGTPKTAFISSCLIILFTCSINSYLLFYDRNVIVTKSLNKIDCYKLPHGFRIGQIWETVHLIIYTVIPFGLMVFFNILLLKKIYNVNNTNDNTRNKLKMRKLRELTVSLLVITISFLVMTLPAAICYVYFSKVFKSSAFLSNILILIDYWSFLNHSSLFFHCFITNLKFRSIVIKKVKIIFDYIL
jgi:hypothetical protein